MNPLIPVLVGLLTVVPNQIHEKKVPSKVIVHIIPKKVVKSKAVKKVYSAVVTTYSRKFEGRLMANGKRFSHSNNYIACRSYPFGTRLKLYYGRASSEVVIGDRGRLPLHKKNKPQFDLPQKVAKELGLYKIKNGKTDRNIKYTIINTVTSK